MQAKTLFLIYHLPLIPTAPDKHPRSLSSLIFCLISHLFLISTATCMQNSKSLPHLSSHSLFLPATCISIPKLSLRPRLPVSSSDHSQHDAKIHNALIHHISLIPVACNLHAKPLSSLISRLFPCRQGQTFTGTNAYCNDKTTASSLA